MTIGEILTAAQMLTFEERKKLIQELFVQLPKSSRLAGSAEQVGDLNADKTGLKTMVKDSLVWSASELSKTEERKEQMSMYVSEYVSDAQALIFYTKRKISWYL